MTARLLELLFRRKLILITPLVVGFVLGVLWLSYSHQGSLYVSSASVWIDRPSAVSGGAVTDFNPYASPAQNQTGIMQELLASKAFVVGVLNNLAITRPTEGEIALIRTNTTIFPVGAHLVIVQFSSPDPRTAALTVKAVLDQYTLNFAKQLKLKAAQASDYYQAQLGVAKDSFDDSNAAFQSYIRAHPQVALTTTQNAPTASLDPEFIKLQLSQQSAKESYDKIQSNYGQSQIIANSSDGISAYFSVMDQPEVPQFPVPLSKKAMLMKVALGTLLGVSIATAIFVLLWRGDRKVRVPNDLDYLEIEIVSLPKLKVSSRRRWPTTFVAMSGSLQAGLATLAPSRRQAVSTSGPLIPSAPSPQVPQ